MIPRCRWVMSLVLVVAVARADAPAAVGCGRASVQVLAMVLGEP